MEHMRSSFSSMHNANKIISGSIYSAAHHTCIYAKRCRNASTTVFVLCVRDELKI